MMLVMPLHLLYREDNQLSLDYYSAWSSGQKDDKFSNHMHSSSAIPVECYAERARAFNRLSQEFTKGSPLFLPMTVGK